MPNNELLFKFSEFSIAQLVEYVDTGIIALPELQRPFVWDAVKVRDLFDSLYRGMPIGVIILWEIYEGAPSKPIGGNKVESPKYVVIDGQQRLTSFYAVIKNRGVFSKNFRQTKLKIAFNLLDERFEVWDAAIEKDPRWIPNISEIFEKGNSFSFVKDLIQKLKGSGIEFSEDKIASEIGRIYNIQDFKVQAIELFSKVDLEEVAEIFVRINSKGKVLNQSDFIMTLMSVYWDEGRKEIEEFCEKSRKAPVEKNDPSPFNVIGIEPYPENIVRSLIGYGFLRGRLKYAYLALRGRDLETEQESEEVRERNFSILKESQKEVLDLTNWHGFIKEISDAGFVNRSLITSDNAFYATYSIYLLLKKFGVDYDTISSFIKEWFAFSILTQRYTSSPESVIERDLMMFKDVTSKNVYEIVKKMRNIIDVTLTDDYWKLTLPNNLETSSTRSPSFVLYLASLVRKDAYILFSDTKLKDYLSPLFKFKKKPIDIHHIFPKNYLKKLGIEDRKLVNQVGNLVYVEYKKNIKIADKPPKEYFEDLQKIYSTESLEEMLNSHAIPENFFEMDYQTFLNERRKLMAKEIGKYFKTLRREYIFM